MATTTSARMKSFQVIIAIIAGLVTISTAAWKIGKDYLELKQKVDRIEQDASQFRHFILAPPQTEMSAHQLEGAWDISYGNRTGKLGGRAISKDLLTFQGNIYRGPKEPALTFEGKGTLKRTEARPEIEYSFFTKGQKPGEDWHGSGVLYVISKDFLQGWFDDQLRRHERIEVKRAF